MEQLLAFDQQLLLAINGCHADWADALFWYVSEKWIWIPLYLLLAALLWQRFGWRKMLLMLLGFALAVGLSDFLTSGVLKPLVARWRPSRDPQIGGLIHIVNDYRGGKYGFPSSHASDTMACAMLFSLLWRNWKATVPMMVWVALNCYSRMYLGVHYPLDILAGLCIGSVMAWLAYRCLAAASARTWAGGGGEANPPGRS
ncbi:MAG: phosphatase PAP2 family protein [Paludibacteraceae bacterium]|nr:phosphatase PAP2 family protein [Paludibacteraceae bacterium]